MAVFTYTSNERVETIGAATWQFNLVARDEVTTFQPDGARPNTTGSTTNLVPITLKNTANRDEAGMFPRGVVIKWVSAPPAGYKPGGKIFIPVFRFDRWQAYRVSGTVDYLGAQAIIVSKLPEVIRS